MSFVRRGLDQTVPARCCLDGSDRHGLHLGICLSDTREEVDARREEVQVPVLQPSL